MTLARILLVDDEPLILSSLSRRLKSRFEVATTESGIQAIAAVEEAMHAGEPFSVVLCDMHMPGMDGVQTLAQIRAMAPETIGIMLTGDADQQTAITAINQGNIFRFYVKPFDSTVLSDGIAAAVRQHELLMAERHLAENEERWRLALESVGDGVWDWMPPTNETTYSESWHRMLGLPTPPMPAHISHWWDRIHPQDASMVAAQIDRMLQGKDSSFLCEHRLLCGDDSYRWFLGRGVVLFRAANGDALRVIGTHSDVTDRRLKMASLARMAAGFAHEINTPIGVALTAVSEEQDTLKKIQTLLAGDDVSEAELQAELESINRCDQLAVANLRRCTEMVQRFKRAFVDQASEQSRVFDLAEVIEDACFCLHDQLKRLPITIQVDCPPNIKIEGVPGRIEQILTNLILNAIKHGFEEGTRQGTICLTITLHNGNRLRMLFSDDGKGMPPDVAEHVFEPFFTTARSSGGSGLGLFLCYNIITVELGGSVACRSAPDQGTRFEIEFPVTLSNDAIVTSRGPS